MVRDLPYRGREATPPPEVVSGSAAQLAFYRYVVPVAAVVVAGLFTASGAPLGFLLFAFAFAVVFYAYSAKLRRVTLVGACLVVSNGKRSVHVPVGEVLHVDKRIGNSPPIVTVVLRSPSAFGSRIRFIPRELAPLFTFQENPIVERVREVCAAHPEATCAHALPDAAQQGPAADERRRPG